MKMTLSIKMFRLHHISSILFHHIIWGWSGECVSFYLLAWSCGRFLMQRALWNSQKIPWLRVKKFVLLILLCHILTVYVGNLTSLLWVPMTSSVIWGCWIGWYPRSFLIVSECTYYLLGKIFLLSLEVKVLKMNILPKVRSSALSSLL